jgi:hypothetical protein
MAGARRSNIKGVRRAESMIALARSLHSRHCEFTPAFGRPFRNESGSKIDAIRSQGCNCLPGAAKHVRTALGLQGGAASVASVARMERSVIRVLAGMDATQDFASLHSGYGSRRNRHKRWQHRRRGLQLSSQDCERGEAERSNPSAGTVVTGGLLHPARAGFAMTRGLAAAELTRRLPRTAKAEAGCGKHVPAKAGMEAVFR